MDGFLAVFITLGVLFGFLFIGGINWYRVKEIREKRALDLQILALDHDAEFREINASFEWRLFRLIGGIGAESLSKGRIRNIISKQHLDYQSSFFDMHIFAGGNSGKAILRHGILVEFGYELPHKFHIGPKGFWDWLSFSGYPRVEAYLNPLKMRAEFSVFAAREDQKGIHRFMNQNETLIELVNDEKFLSMVVRDNQVVLIYAGQRPASLYQHQTQGIRTAKIARVFAKVSAEDDIQISVLKAGG